jgi:hypothetical protein
MFQLLKDPTKDPDVEVLEQATRPEKLVELGPQVTTCSSTLEEKDLDKCEMPRSNSLRVFSR